MESMPRSKRDTQKVIGLAITVIAAILGIYHFIYARYMLTSAYRHIMIHYLGCFVLLFLDKIKPGADREAFVEKCCLLGSCSRRAC